MPRAQRTAVLLPDRPQQRFGPFKTLATAAGVISLLVPVALVERRVQPGGRPRFVRLFHRALSRALGIRISVDGAPARRGGVLFVANHVSYLDIFVLGAHISGAFVAKSEVADWGFFGWMATLARTVYVERGRRTTTGLQRNAIVERLAAGRDIILFPEGTNSDGIGVMPFKSALFAAVEGPGAEDFLIQPVTIAYTRANGMPITRGMLPEIAWVGDSELVPHALAFMKLGRIRAEIRFHPAVRAADFSDRKALMRHCHTVIASSYQQMMRGRVHAG